MSYCRWSEGDVYMFHSIDGYVECCACSLQPLVPTIMTVGCELFDDKFREPCAKCGGAFEDDHSLQCTACGMHGSMHLGSFQAALEHLYVHQAAGHDVPPQAFERLQKDIDDGRVVEKKEK